MYWLINSYTVLARALTWVGSLAIVVLSIVPADDRPVTGLGQNLAVCFSNRPFGVKRFQTIHITASTSLAGSCFSSESAPGSSMMGFEDEMEQSEERPCRQTLR
jgi:hypothetical protein